MSPVNISCHYELTHWGMETTNGWVNNRDAGDLRRHNVTVMMIGYCTALQKIPAIIPMSWQFTALHIMYFADCKAFNYLSFQICQVINGCVSPLKTGWRHSKWPTIEISVNTSSVSMNLGTHWVKLKTLTKLKKQSLSRPEYFARNNSVPQLLMPWWQKEPGKLPLCVQLLV